MSKIISQQPVRFTLDTFRDEYKSLIAMRQGNFLDCTSATSINGFTLSYSQPANTKIAFVFSTGSQLEYDQLHLEGGTSGTISQDTARGTWFKLKSNGLAQLVPTQDIDADSVLAEGNTIAELQALTSIQAFKGYRVRAAVALYSPNINAVPSVSLSLKGFASDQQLTKTEYSSVYELGENAQIINVIADIQESNGGKVNLYGSINGSEWQTFSNLAGQKAQTLQLKADFSAVQVGVSTAKLNNVNIIYSNGSGIINGEGVSEIISKTHNWYKPVKIARVVVKHAQFGESYIKVYASFRKNPVICQGEILGTGDDMIHSYQLAHTNGINFESVKIYFDNVRVTTGYEVNCEVGRITCTPPAGAMVTCDYEYGWEDEDWRELEFSQTVHKPDYDESEYYLINDTPGYICAIKLTLHTTTGKINNESIGKGTGQAATYRLAHNIKEGEITITANNSILSSNNYQILEDSHYIKIAAANGVDLKASYTWISEPAVIYEFSGIFSE